MYSEEMGDDTVGCRIVACWSVMVAVPKDDVPHDATNAVIDAEARLVPSVKGEEDGVLGESGDTFGEERTNGSRGKGALMDDVGVEESGKGLSE